MTQTDHSERREERRKSSRFPIERPVIFKVSNRKAGEVQIFGKTINMSSKGVLIAIDEELVLGRRAELAISWPAQLNDSCPLKLVAKARVVRTEPGRAALELLQYEFRTLGSTAFPV